MFEKLFDYIPSINRQNTKDSEAIRISKESWVAISEVVDFLDMAW